MTMQRFKVTVRVETDIESSGEPYLTEARVKRQIEKFLKNRHMAENLPCHGSSTILVTDVVEDSK